MEAEFSRIEIIGSMSKVSAFIEMLSSKHIKEYISSEYRA